MHSNELVKGTLKTIILKLLAEEGKMYGYEITQHVHKLSMGKIKLTEGALYPSLHKLQAEGMLESESLMIGKRKRKYYFLTRKGTATTKAKVAEFEDFISTMSQLLDLKPTQG